MLVSQNLLSGKRKYLFALTLLPFITVICVAFSVGNSENFDLARREILLRKIGHELLLQSGDSISRVLPVEKVNTNEYRIRFEKELTFKTDSLVNTTGRLLGTDPLARDYVISVLNCSSDAVIYGYAISDNKKDDIVTCKGRKQPTACYIIDIKFKPKGLNTATTGYVLGGLPFLAFVGFLFFRSAKPRREAATGEDAGTITLGSVQFDAKYRKLIINGTTSDLTGTETRLLSIFASAPNQIIARKRLQKEIWEDEGVIVGRSLDMFISKLRKKLEEAQDINIVVVRGKGYRLEISA
ncbi:winged helix-turn-helix domain-containing protein [Mucilaginibacter calamicampi]|uniref:Winged helix-turn-helix domain-containing protein n=1 Tax=Mucilaginibacter calamicampi TaxID=1302352 RepID=A0ABW2YWS5_9SPHI